MNHAENITRAIKACEGALMVVAGYDAMQLSGDMTAPFLQEANFWWLTGIEEPGWAVIIEGARGKVTLVRPNLTETQQIFDGGMTDKQAMALCNAQAVIAEQELEQELKQLARSHPRVVTVTNVRDEYFHKNPAQNRMKSKLERIFERAEPCNRQLAELRAIKQPYEIEQIKKAVNLTCDTFKKVRASWADYKYEYQVEAKFTYEFKNQNSEHAYAPIVAAGAQACTLHYEKNNQAISKKDAVVIDIGARVNGYAADITRTYCAAPTKRAQEVHSSLAQAQRQIINLLGPDLPVGEYIKEVDNIMQNALAQLGLISYGDKEAYRKYFPHAIGHGLGVDVHDSLGAPRYFKPGMVLTVEPGIYIPEEGLGMRIEDNILITATGRQNLSSSLSTDL